MTSSGVITQSQRFRMIDNAKIFGTRTFHLVNNHPRLTEIYKHIPMSTYYNLYIQDFHLQNLIQIQLTNDS